MTRLATGTRVAAAIVLSLALLSCERSSRRASHQHQPNLVFDPTEVDLGRLTAGQVVTTSVRATNVSSKALIINNLNGGCACVAQIADARPLLPGGSRDIVIELSTKALVDGPLTRHITFSTDDTPRGKHTITLTADVVHEFEVLPTVLDFGRISSRSTARRDIDVVARRSGVAFTGVRTTNSAISVKLLGRSSASRLTAVASLRPLSKPGDHYGVLIIETSSEFNRQIRIPIFVTVE